MKREYMPLMTDDKFFSKRADFPQRLPWDLIEDCERQAEKNHSQSLDKLASRGGLHPVEAYCIMRGLGYRYIRSVTDEAAAEFIEKKVLAYNKENSENTKLKKTINLLEKKNTILTDAINGVILYKEALEQLDKL